MTNLNSTMGLIGWEANFEFTTITEYYKESVTLSQSVNYYLNK